MDIDELMTAEEFFGEADNGGKGPSRARGMREKKSDDGLFSKMKVKMIMRINGVSRSRALEIISEREAAALSEKNGARDGGNKGGDSETLMPADEFFA